MRTFWRIEMDYISVREAAQKWKISERRVQKLCEESRIDGIQKFGRSWMIPKTANKPIDLRRKDNSNKAGEMLCITRSLKHL